MRKKTKEVWKLHNLVKKMPLNYPINKKKKEGLPEKRCVRGCVRLGWE